MRILVTGAGGFVGRALCRALLDAGEHVVAMWHRDRVALDGLVDIGDLTPLQADIRTDDLLPLCRGIDAVVHLAVQPPGAPAAAKTNIQGTQNLLDACLQAEVGHLVYASSMSVYDFLAPDYLPVDEAHPCRPLQEYGREKLQGEEICLAGGQEGGLGVCALRLAGIFGPGKPTGAAYAFARAILSDQPVQIESDRTVDLLYVDDAVQALRRALAVRAEGIFNIGSGEGCSLSGLAEAIGAHLGRRVQIKCDGQGNVFVLDIARARRELDYSPLGLAAALEGYVPWVQRHAAD